MNENIDIHPFIHSYPHRNNLDMKITYITVMQSKGCLSATVWDVSAFGSAKKVWPNLVIIHPLMYES